MSNLDLTAVGDIRRILIIKWSAMGDLIISTILFEDIRRAFPVATIDLNTLPQWTSLFAGDTRFDNIHAVDVRRKQGGFAGLWRWLALVRKGNYDLIVDLQGNDRSRLLIFFLLLLGGAPRYRLGLHRRWPFNVAPEPFHRGKHSIDLQRAALLAGGIPTVTSRPSLQLDSDDKARVDLLLADNGLLDGDYAVLMPGSQAAGWLKRWGSARYASLAIRLHEGGIDKVVLVGGPDEEDECRRIATKCHGSWLVDLCGKTKVTDLIPLAENACLIVSNDTGTAHVASCTDTPMLVICGPTNPDRVKPVGPSVQTIQADLDCVNCYKKECSHHSCMESLTVEAIFDKVNSMSIDNQGF